MADRASLPSPNLPYPLPHGTPDPGKGKPNWKKGARSPGCPEAALPTPRSRQWWFYRLTGQSWQGLGAGGAGRKQGAGPSLLGAAVSHPLSKPSCSQLTQPGQRHSHPTPV